ncbi:MAG: UDP-N-acetylmuramoyl-L-alanine--D-glutamate ligase [Gammaproteobacteria bacterium]
MLSQVSAESNNAAQSFDAVIIGLGATGLACARFLHRQGVVYAITDSREFPPQYHQLLAEQPDTALRLGGFDRHLIASAKQVILSPGVSPAEPAIQAALVAGVEVLGDIELFARHADAPVLAITGANGKSTVTALVAEMANAGGVDARCGGNLGTPALELLGPPEPALYVLELSSFQLELTYSLNAAAATVLNVTPDHMDRHPSFRDYARAKQRIFNGDGAMVLNGDDPVVAHMAIPGRPQLWFSLGDPGEARFGLRRRSAMEWICHGGDPLLPVSELKLAGRHNVANALAALALGSAANLPRAGMLHALREFQGLPHRCQWVAGDGGVDWYNDSKGTNVGATRAAILGLAEDRRIVLIAGGIAKGADFAELAATSQGYVRAVVVLGRDGPAIARAFQGIVPVEKASDMSDAVSLAKSLAQPGDAVLLSPACASFDLFNDYAHRGQVFMREVKNQLRMA